METPGPAQQPAPALPQRREACIVGEVQSRQGDGANFLIRKGPCTVQLTALDATIAWNDGDSHGLAAMPLADFHTHLRNGAVAFVDTPAG
jgi:hypothetical protein